MNERYVFDADEKQRLQLLNDKKSQIKQIKKHLEKREYYEQALVNIAIGLSFIVAIIVMLVIAILFSSSFVSYFALFIGFLSGAVLYRTIGFFGEATINKMPKEKELFIDFIKEYELSAESHKSIERLKSSVQSSNALTHKDIEAWFNEEINCIDLQLKHILEHIRGAEFKKQNAWFYQPSGNKQQTDELKNLDVDAVISNCSSRIELPSSQNKTQENSK